MALAAPGCARGPAEPQAQAAAAAAPYPSLASVPPRPRLGYGPEQGRAVEGELVRDRENAAYLGAVVDYETGRTEAPPPAPPAPAAAAAAPPAERAPVRPRGRGPGDSPAVEAYVEDALARDSDDGELEDFLRRLERPVPGAVGAPASGAAPGADGRPRTPALRSFGDYLGGVLGVERDPAAAAAAPSAALVTVSFADGSDALPAGAEAGLERALAQARARGARLRIAGGGEAGALPADRTRAVAEALLRLGATADLIELAPGGVGGGGAVRVGLSPPPTPDA